jgi:hypothetical protein
VEDAIPKDIDASDKDFSRFTGNDKHMIEVDFLCNKQFELPVIAIVLITILNDGTIISIAYDTVVASPRPEHWRLPEVFLVSTLLGTVAVASSIFLLWCGLTANSNNSIFHKVGLVGLPTDTYTTTNDLDWQHSDHDAVKATKHPCPPGGCTWDMCNPFKVSPINDKDHPGDAALKDGKIQPFTFTEHAEPYMLDWAQPTYCFGYNRTCTRCSDPTESMRICLIGAATTLPLGTDPVLLSIVAHRGPDDDVHENLAVRLPYRLRCAHTGPVLLPCSWRAPVSRRDFCAWLLYAAVRLLAVPRAQAT